MKLFVLIAGILFLVTLTIKVLKTPSASQSIDIPTPTPAVVYIEPTDTPIPTPALIQCNLSDKVVYTQTQQDCDNLQSQENSPRMLPPCAVFGPVAYVPCTQMP